MLEKEPSGASADCTKIPQPCEATPGGPFPPGTARADSALTAFPPAPCHTLQFLIAVIKKHA
jgi:hypothetical protein